MKSKTNEQALEAFIEKSLTGYNTDELLASGNFKQVLEEESYYGHQKLFAISHRENYNAEFAIDNHYLWQFLENSQEDELNKLKRHADWKLKILSRLDKTLKRKGILHVLKKGLAVEDSHFVFFFQPPTASSSNTVKKRFKNNIFSIMRQVPYNALKPQEDIDMVIFLNGLPIITMELKNKWTGQNARHHGVKQYKEGRDNKQPLLQFARCIVHFAVDPDEIYMTTKLDGKSSFFLPFNKGHNFGKGNPPNPTGFKTAYLWDEVLQKVSLANIIQNFVLLDGNSQIPLNDRTLFFPRYHQLDVVRELLKDINEHGVGKRYLIQHSAGSGKSHSITWLAYQLIGVQDQLGGEDKVLFDSVIVVTDRRILDKQLKDNIAEFSEMKNIIAHAKHSSDLRNAMEQGKRIIISTIQKFNWIVDELSDQSNKRFAVLIDEAHSSQGGSYSANLNTAMGSDNEEEEVEDLQEIILKAMNDAKMKNNASYFAFTATPKNSTLEKFGVKQEDGKFKPFHLYSMKQAIEEGFILDVLTNYTTYNSFYEIQKSVEDNPEFDSARAQKKLKAFAEKNPDTIAIKAQIMVEHFLEKVVKTKKLKGKAKAMVLTQSIPSAINYYKAIKAILKEKGSPFKIVVAFSGTKTVGGIDYTESGMNGFSEGDTKDTFDTDEYRMLVVANKYLTGFNQPKLSTMYIDKKLTGITAVQALSRLNRSNKKLNKRTEDIFILDFFNSTDDMKKAFDEFYTSTLLTSGTDVNVLHDLKESLDETFVYEAEEVEQFNEAFFRGAEIDQLDSMIEKSAERFNNSLGLLEEQKVDFKVKAKQFVKVYSQIAAIIPYNMVTWEKLFWFLKFLIPKLVVRQNEDQIIDDILESVDLSTYGLQRSQLNATIQLDDSDSEIDAPNANPRGAHGGDGEVDQLENIIRIFNERYFDGWDATPENQKVKLVSLRDQVRNHDDYDSKVKNNRDVENRNIALKQILDEIVIKGRKSEIDFYKNYSQNSTFAESVLLMMIQTLNNELGLNG